MYKKLIIILAVILAVLISDRLIFTTTGLQIEINPEVLKANPGSELVIKAYKSNILGFKVPFSETDLRFEVEEGSNLIELKENSDGTVTVRSRGIEGEAFVGVYYLKSGLQLRKILIKILPRDFA